MQTRKRAKSVSFGKKKDKEEKEHIKKTVDEESAAPSVEVAPEKVEEEKNSKEEKVETPVLSPTLPHVDEEEKESNEKETKAATPADDFVIDTSPATSEPSAEMPQEVNADSEKSESKEQEETTKESASPIEIKDQPTTSEVPEHAESQELSSTLPPSAFTIQTQNNETPAEQQPSESESETEIEEKPEKKHFGLYFLVVAFLSFVLGLGAMAGASYLGLVHVNITKLPTPSFLGQKPSPTMPVPTAPPTQKPVDLTAYTITILNGSGISGKAADEKTALTTAGFKISSTGNAANSNFTKTEISAKKAVDPAYITKLEDELGKTFTVDTATATSPASDQTDVTVTLGSSTK